MRELVNYAPIALFVYNRPHHTSDVVKSLLQCPESKNSELYVFSDAPKVPEHGESVRKVREIIDGLSGFCKVTVVTRESNWGLAKSIIDGVSQLTNKFGKVIVVEDDLKVSPFFLRYMNEALQMFQDEDRVGAISGFVNPIKEPMSYPFFLRYFACWGWATWGRSWNLFISDAQKLINELKKDRIMIQNFEIDYSIQFYNMLKAQSRGDINSWAIRYYASLFVNNKLVLYPGASLVEQNGMDGTGTHCLADNTYAVKLSPVPVVLSQDICVEENPEAFRQYRDFYLSITSKKHHVKRFLQKLHIL